MYIMAVTAHTVWIHLITSMGHLVWCVSSWCFGFFLSVGIPQLTAFVCFLVLGTGSVPPE